MSLNSLGAAAVAAIIATLCTLVCSSLAAPAPVSAAPETMRVAVVNLEQVARASRTFQQRKIKWEDAQQESKNYLQELKHEYDSKLRELGRTNDEPERMQLRVELQALEEAKSAASEEQQKYLAALLSMYQQEVLSEVLENLRRYVRQKGFNLVLQNYDVDEEYNDFFSGGAYAQSLMSQIVLDAPGAATGDNVFVTDITADMAAAMKKGGVPENPKDD
ncbi:MAG: OmpH family outer membrane protein [Planctomycetes bacterium]|nr:OmpH family outer membrane protein [Planctomycetota bacterium]